VVVDDIVLFGVITTAGDQQGGMVALDTATGAERWRSGDLGVPVLSSPAHEGGMVYVTTFSGKLTALDVSTGDEAWHLELGGVLSDSPLVEDGVVYFQAGDAFYAATGP
jgi:outer membrane protein assembly factor BamB